MNNIESQINNLLDQYRLSIQKVKTTTSEEAWKILQLSVAIVVTNLESIAISLSGPDKKKIALNSISNFYDKVFVVVDVPFIPNLFEPLVHKYVKAFLLVLVSASIDATVATFREIGFFKGYKISDTILISSVNIKNTKKKIQSNPKPKKQRKIK